MKICKCGEQIQDGEKICKKCGAKVEARLTEPQQKAKKQFVTMLWILSLLLVVMIESIRITGLPPEIENYYSAQGQNLIMRILNVWDISFYVLLFVSLIETYKIKCWGRQLRQLLLALITVGVLGCLVFGIAVLTPNMTMFILAIITLDGILIAIKLLKPYASLFNKKQK